jgi:hypothetical protein
MMMQVVDSLLYVMKPYGKPQNTMVLELPLILLFCVFGKVSVICSPAMSRLMMVCYFSSPVLQRAVLAMALLVVLATTTKNMKSIFGSHLQPN